MSYQFEYGRKGPDHVLMTDLGIHFRFMKLREEHGEEVGTLRVYTIDYPGLPDRDLFVGKTILLGPRSKADAAKLCATRCPTFPAWSDLIDEACKRMLEIHSDGDPWTDLSIGEVSPDAPYLVDPLIRLDEPTVIYGAGGSGKSTVGLAIAMALASGKDHLWEFGMTEVPQRVGYLDYEDSEATFKRRLRALAAGAGINTPQVFYKRGEASLPASAESLGRQAADLGLTGLIVDSAGFACGGEPEKADAALNYYRAVRSLPIQWSVTIAHQPKDKENSSYPFGSIMWWNGCRMCWKLVGAPGPDGLGIGLVHRKANNGELSENIGLLFKRDGESAILERRDPRKLVGLRAHLQNPGSIADVLKDNGPMAPAQIADAAGLSRGGIYTLLQRQIDAGTIRKGKGGLYEFTGAISDTGNEFGIPFD